MKLKILLFTILFSVGFFNPLDKVPESLQKLGFYACILCGAIVAIVYDKPLKNNSFPRFVYVVLLFGILLSGIMATSFHMQSLGASMSLAIQYFFAYSLVYILLRFDLPNDKIMNMYIWLCAASTMVYFCNALTLPHNIFGADTFGDDITRGIIRIPLVFIEVFPIVIFYCINQWQEDKKSKWLFIAAFAFLMVILSVVRQVILITAVFALLFLLRSVSWKIKALMCVGVVGIIVFVLPMIPMYNAMIELSEQQKDENEDTENVRIQAWRYYTYENQTNGITPFFGNGIPSLGNSRWGVEFEAETQDNGCYTGDVGWAGFYWYFGLFTTIALLWLLIKGLLRKKPKNAQFVNYSLAMILILSIASAPILYYFQVVTVCVILYMAYKPYADNNVVEVCQSQPTTKLPEYIRRYEQI